MILNLHGLYGTAKNTNYGILTKSYSISEVYSPQIDFENCSPYKIIDELYIQKNIDFIVGNSFGGFFAYVTSAKIRCPCILTNPCIPPTKYIRELVPEYPNGFLKQLEEITKDFSPHKLSKINHNVFVILRKDDEVLDSDFTNIYFKNAKIYRINGGHRLAGIEFELLFKKITVSLCSGNF